MTVGPISALAVHNLSSGTSAFILVVKVDWINKHVCTVVLNWYFNPESMKSYLYARLIEVHGPCSDPSGKLGINNWVSKLKQTHLNGNVWREYVFLWAIFGGDRVRILLCYLLFVCVCVCPPSCPTPGGSPWGRALGGVLHPGIEDEDLSKSWPESSEALCGPLWLPAGETTEEHSVLGEGDKVFMDWTTSLEAR